MESQSQCDEIDSRGSSQSRELGIGTRQTSKTVLYSSQFIITHPNGPKAVNISLRVYQDKLINVSECSADFEF